MQSCTILFEWKPK